VFHPTLRCSGCQSGALLAAAVNETAAEVLASNLAIPTADSYRSARNATIGVSPSVTPCANARRFIGNEDRNFQRERYRQPAAASPRVAGKRITRHRVPPGAESPGRGVPDPADPGAGLRRRMAWPALVERRCNPREGRAAGGDPPRTPRRPGRHAQPLYRGANEGADRRIDLSSERQPSAGAEVRLQARVVRAADRAREH